MMGLAVRPNRDKKRKRKLPESRYPRFRASDATHIESGNLCATSNCAFEVRIRLDILDILRMSARSAKASFDAGDRQFCGQSIAISRRSIRGLLDV
jgi:hypothetical protein